MLDALIQGATYRCHLVRPIAGGKIEGRAHGLDGTVCHILVDLRAPDSRQAHFRLRAHFWLALRRKLGSGYA